MFNLQVITGVQMCDLIKSNVLKWPILSQFYDLKIDIYHTKLDICYDCVTWSLWKTWHMVVMCQQFFE